MQTRLSADVDAGYKGRDSGTLTSLTLCMQFPILPVLTPACRYLCVLKQQPVMPKRYIFFNLENAQPAVDATVWWGQC